MVYAEAITYLESLHKFPAQPGLERMHRLLAFLDNPHRRLRFVHVTGTNGKGSTCAMISSILQAAGYRTGLYTSPHLDRYNERIQIDRQPISDADFLNGIEKIRTLLQAHPAIRPSLFEVLTVLALDYFANQRVDSAVMEVGMGGRLDPTNVISSLVSVITNVDLEHTAILGSSKEKIAYQKAGIIKPHSTVIVGEQNPRLQKIFRREARECDAKLWMLQPEAIKFLKHSVTEQVFHYRDFENLHLSLVGRHQLSNAALAIEAALSLRGHGFSISKREIRMGLKQAYWPLRLERVHRSPDIVLDAAHNLHGVRALLQSIREFFPSADRILILGCSVDKPYKKMAKLLSQVSKLIILTQAQYHGVEPKELQRALMPTKKQLYLSSTVEEALSLARKLAKRNSTIFVLGGLYLAAEARRVIRDSEA